MEEQGFLSRWFEVNLLDKIVRVIERYLERRLELELMAKVCGLVTRKKLMEDLKIGKTTLQQWEEAGLKRYQPPFEDAKKIYYKEADVERFLSM